VNLRRAATLSATLLVAILALSLIGGPAQPLGPATALAAGCPGADKGPRKMSSKRAAKIVVCLLNKQRKKRGKGHVSGHGQLAEAARGHSRRMQRADCFSHECPGEAPLTKRYQRSDYLPCKCSWGAAENIAWGAGRKGSPRKIVDAWMHSPPHRANILGSYEHVGVGVRWGSPSKRKARAGTYTLDFGYKR
jgi:uncharacterized protein YkwD